ncbi:hypothetical protein NLG97_g1435 [Lecanicillium saksenae]|uniref:Uncharacterized protein n=1 Tax=Lecanicillium saksenae TaxID=468837 RepID=A0ACC1R6E6_9HYPO|nr:hypothetical protein NLG97_g1435 [Lecanicillium saksenae]
MAKLRTLREVSSSPCWRNLWKVKKLLPIKITSQSMLPTSTTKRRDHTSMKTDKSSETNSPAEPTEPGALVSEKELETEIQSRMPSFPQGPPGTIIGGGQGMGGGQGGGGGGGRRHRNNNSERGFEEIDEEIDEDVEMEGGGGGTEHDSAGGQGGRMRRRTYIKRKIRRSKRSNGDDDKEEGGGSGSGQGGGRGQWQPPSKL